MVNRTVLQPLGCKRSRRIAARPARHSQRAASRTVRQAAFPLRFSGNWFVRAMDEMDENDAIRFRAPRETDFAATCLVLSPLHEALPN
jgi:hypothetical protein